MSRVYNPSKVCHQAFLRHTDLEEYGPRSCWEPKFPLDDEGDEIIEFDQVFGEQRRDLKPRFCSGWKEVLPHIDSNGQFKQHYLPLTRSFYMWDRISPKREGHLLHEVDDSLASFVRPKTNACVFTRLPLEILQMILRHLLPTKAMFYIFRAYKSDRCNRQYFFVHHMRPLPPPSPKPKVKRHRANDYVRPEATHSRPRWMYDTHRIHEAQPLGPLDHLTALATTCKTLHHAFCSVLYGENRFAIDFSPPFNCDKDDKRLRFIPKRCEEAHQKTGLPMDGCGDVCSWIRRYPVQTKSSLWPLVPGTVSYVKDLSVFTSELCNRERMKRKFGELIASLQQGQALKQLYVQVCKEPMLHLEYQTHSSEGIHITCMKGWPRGYFDMAVEELCCMLLEGFKDNSDLMLTGLTEDVAEDERPRKRKRGENTHG